MRRAPSPSTPMLGMGTRPARSARRTGRGGPAAARAPAAESLLPTHLRRAGFQQRLFHGARSPHGACRRCGHRPAFEARCKGRWASVLGTRFGQSDQGHASPPLRGPWKGRDRGLSIPHRKAREAPTQSPMLKNAQRHDYRRRGLIGSDGLRNWSRVRFSRVRANQGRSDAAVDLPKPVGNNESRHRTPTGPQANRLSPNPNATYPRASNR